MRYMRIFTAILVALAVVFALVGPAEAAKRPKKCSNHNYKVHHPKKCGKTKHKKVARAQRVSRAKAAPAPRVATRAEYNQLKPGMTLPQVKTLFDAPIRKTFHEDFAILVGCPIDSKYFCMTDDSTLEDFPNNVDGTGTVVAAGPRDHYEVYNGVDKYEGFQCWNIQLDFYGDALGVMRLRSWENWSNLCSSKYN